MSPPARIRWRCEPVAISSGGVHLAAPGFAPSGFPAERIDVLEDVDDDHHFWAGPRRRLLERRLELALRGRVGAAIDLGCGLGAFTRRLLRHADSVVGVDGHAAALEQAALRSTEVIWVQGDVARTPFADRQFDVVCLLDVLEHTEPRALLAETARLLTPGGLLLLSVPAFPSLWSEIDTAAGHRCRYTRATLRREIEAAGLVWRSATHFQMTWFPLLWIARRVVRLAPRRQRAPASAVAALLRRVNYAEVRLTAGAALPWGTSLIAEARAA